MCHSRPLLPQPARRPEASESLAGARKRPRCYSPSCQQLACHASTAQQPSPHTPGARELEQQRSAAAHLGWGVATTPFGPRAAARICTPPPAAAGAATVGPGSSGSGQGKGLRDAPVTGAQCCIAPRSGHSRGIAESSLHASATEGPRPRDRLGEEQARHSFALSCFPFQLSIPPPPTPSTLSSSRSLSRADSLPAVLANKGLGTRALHAESCWRRLRRRRCGRGAIAVRAGRQPGWLGLGPDPSASRARRSDRAGHCPLRPKTARARQGLGGLSRARLTAPAPPHPSHVWACPEAGPALANGRDSVSRRHSVSLQRHGDTL